MTLVPSLLSARAKAIVAVLLNLALAGLAFGQDAGDQITDRSFQFLRYNENFGFLSDPTLRVSPYAQMKYIPLSDDPLDFLTLGGDDREKVESYQHPTFGKTGLTQDTTYEHRLLIHANLELDSFRAFIEFGNENEEGRLPKALPTDTDRFDLQQAFLDYNTSFGPGHLTLRAGREELLFGEGLLIGPRDAPNIRQDWDGFRAMFQQADLKLDLFAVRPVNNLTGIFDDETSSTQALWGAYTTVHPEAIAPVALDLYAFGFENSSYTLSDGTGADHRATLGVRGYGTLGRFDVVIEAIGQTGSFDKRNVLAYAFHSELGFTESGVWSSPRLGLRVDDISGNRNRGSGTEGSFNPISPNLSYSTEAAIESACNLRQVGMTLGITPIPAVSVSYEYEGLWRDSTQDAFYIAPQIPLFQPHGENQRFSGTEQQIYGSWRINPFLQLKGALVHFEPGAFITSSGGHAINYAMVAGSLRF
jgi:hypothetical protein